MDNSRRNMSTLICLVSQKRFDIGTTADTWEKHFKVDREKNTIFRKINWMDKNQKVNSFYLNADGKPFISSRSAYGMHRSKDNEKK